MVNASSIPAILEILAELSDDEVATYLDDCRNAQGFWANTAGKFEAELLRRMLNAQERLRVGDEWRLDYETTAQYNWNVAALEKGLRPKLTQEQWEKLFDYPEPAPPPEPKVKTAVIMGLAKKLGPAERALIEKASGKTEIRPRVKLTRLVPEEGTLD